MNTNKYVFDGPMFRFVSVFCSLTFCFFTASSSAQLLLDETTFDHTIERALNEFNTPGMAVGIVKNQEVVFAKGFGIASFKSATEVDSSTLFRIGSLSKAFTASGLAILVDQGKLNWDDKVQSYLPNFTLYSPYVSQNFTVLDLLTHRSGLASGAGDSMIWPEPSGFTRQEVIHNLRYLSPQYGFRAKYAYSNVLYITAGELIEKISGLAFEEFIDAHIFTPLDMNCFAGDIPKQYLPRVALAYGYNDARGIYPIPRNNASEKGIMASAAGGIVCDLHSMNKWAKAWLNLSSLPISEQSYKTMTTGYTLLSVSDEEHNWDAALFKQYGLGWRLSNIGRFETISHTGTISGYQSYMLLVPELDLGIVILNNGSNSAARGAVMQTIVKKFVSDAVSDLSESNDWIETYIDYLDGKEAEYLRNYQAPVAKGPMLISNKDILGDFKDAWFGNLNIKQHNGQMRIASERMLTLKGKLLPFSGNSYKIEWDNKNAASDAFIHFSVDSENNVVSASLHPFTAKQRENHAYRDMLFYKQ